MSENEFEVKNIGEGFNALTTLFLMLLCRLMRICLLLEILVGIPLLMGVAFYPTLQSACRWLGATVLACLAIATASYYSAKWITPENLREEVLELGRFPTQ